MASWNLYDQFRLRQLNGNAIDLDNPPGSGFYVQLVTGTYTPDQAAHDFEDDITNEVTGTNYTAGGAALATPTVALATGTITFDGDETSLVWAQHASGFSNARRAILYLKRGGAASADELVAYSDDFGSDKGNVAGPFSITLDTNGIFQSAR